MDVMDMVISNITPSLIRGEMGIKASSLWLAQQISSQSEY
jgi:hypothetical protein